MHIGRYDNEYPGGFPDFWNSSSFCLFHLSGAYNAAVGITSGPGPGALFAFMLFAVMTSFVVIVISSRMLYSWPYGVEPCYVKQTNSLGSTIVHIESCITEISLRSNYVERKHSSVAKASANLVLFYSWYEYIMSSLNVTFNTGSNCMFNVHCATEQAFLLLHNFELKLCPCNIFTLTKFTKKTKLIVQKQTYTTQSKQISCTPAEPAWQTTELN